MTERDELIAALEKADGPSQELDAEIYDLITPSPVDTDGFTNC